MVSQSTLIHLLNLRFPEKIPLNIVYLNTIQDEAQKQYFVQELSRELYDWMLTQQPADGELKLLFFMDSCALSSTTHVTLQQKISSNSFSNRHENTVLLVSWRHRTFPMLTTRFSLKPIRPSLDASLSRRMLRRFAIFSKRAERPRFGCTITNPWQEQFQMVAPDVDPAPVPIQCRWLYTDHGAPLNEDQVEDIISAEIRAWAKSVLLDERVRDGSSPCGKSSSTWSTETTRMNPRVLSKLHEFRPLEA